MNAREATPRAGAGGWLEVDLGAIAANWRALREKVGPDVRVGAAVKADAYGLGMDRVAPALYAAGCRNFFVAHAGEGLTLAPMIGRDAAIFVLNGCMPGAEDAVADANLLPVLNSLDQIERYRACAQAAGRSLPCAVQVDSGMSRFGLSASEVRALQSDAHAFRGLIPVLVMSHLACADEPAHPANRAQFEAFRALRPMLPEALASLAASSGIFLGPSFHFDLVRPGAALYGINPTPGQPNPMRDVVRLYARLIQARNVDTGTAVGYGAHFIADRPRRIATLAVGYGDGWPRVAGGRAFAVLPEKPDIHLPVIGRVSMDSLALDVTELGDVPLPAGVPFELIGPHVPLETVAEGLQTIGYEVLTSLGSRYHRTYVNG
ncbi:alanine racemase [Tanticharoenia sakaeratensis]|uniref:Alanine racemase n=1 Tax=Tanticharoenia sakaeratensis NBRC 103193 TaxID=1231623 RepID=A0A0D6MIN4_9PROT|nr:alanine racemase [Tanticharoenia sakaeratensis]GAN53487.1 alanine racemase [Tanticharoenia sakaeratensis NBRC 103193]GBQ17745.1 alanine racemase [Tanticharoenia sakaeratensis NBRC 103193]